MKRLLGFFLLMFAISGCSIERWAVGYFDTHPDRAAQYCNDRFPVTPSVKPGVPEHTVDTQRIPGPSIRCPSDSAARDQSPDTSAVIKCPDNYIVHDTIHRVDTITVPDTRQVAVLQAENSKLKENNIKLQAEADRWKSGRNWWRTACLITWGIMVAAAAGWIFAKSKLI